MLAYPPESLAPWRGLVDDAAVFPPGNAEPADAESAFLARREEWYADFVGSFVIDDRRVGGLTGPLPLSVVVTSGAGGIAPAADLVQRGGHELRGVEVALRDLDDLPGNARRVAAAAQDLTASEVPVWVELPAAPEHTWRAAADVVAEAGLHLKLRLGGEVAEAFPTTTDVASWIDAALDRETPFKCTAGLHQAIRHRDPETGFEHHGFLNVLVATRVLLDGGNADDASALLGEQDRGKVITEAFDTEPLRVRRWFTSFGSCSVTEPLESLAATGLLEDV